MIQFTTLLHRTPHLTHGQFVSHHRNVHAPLFGSVPAVRQRVRRDVQSHSTGDNLPGMPNSRIDGSTELWFDDIAAPAPVFGSSFFMENIRPDESSFLDLHGCEFLLSTEHQVIP